MHRCIIFLFTAGILRNFMNEFLEVVSSHQVYYLSNTSSTVTGPIKRIHSCFTGGNTAWSHLHPSRLPPPPNQETGSYFYWLSDKLQNWVWPVLVGVWTGLYTHFFYPVYSFLPCWQRWADHITHIWNTLSAGSSPRCHDNKHPH